jgi:hypothetical protein
MSLASLLQILSERVRRRAGIAAQTIAHVGGFKAHLGKEGSDVRVGVQADLDHVSE